MKLRTVLMSMLLVVGACGGGSPDATQEDAADPTSTSSSVSTSTAEASTSAPASTTSEARPLADVESLAHRVEVTTGDASQPIALGATAAVGAGDQVSTNAGGFAEIRYYDGAVTRLDANTAFEIVELAADQANGAVRTRFEVGRTWNRVERVAGREQAFEVETSVATATVRGTAFVVWCFEPGRCRILVVEGTVRVEGPDGATVDVDAGEMVDVTEDALGEVEPIPPGGAGAGAWIDANAARDDALGFDELAFRSIERAWVGESVVTFDETDQSPPGTVRPVGVAFVARCSGSDCPLEAQANIEGVGIRTARPVWDGSEYTVVFDYSIEVDGCPFAYTVNWRLQPTFESGGRMIGFSGTELTSISGSGEPGLCFVGIAELGSSFTLTPFGG